MPNSPWSHSRDAALSDDVDFEIKGQELQFVEIELDPGESAVAEAGAMVWKDASIDMTTVFGDGSQGQAGGGFMGKLLGAGKRLVTGESLFTTVFTHNGSGKARVAFASPTPGVTRVMLTAFDVLADHVAAAQGTSPLPNDAAVAAALDQVLADRGVAEAAPVAPAPIADRARRASPSPARRRARSCRSASPIWAVP